ncbi:hypothetical protein SAMN05660493_01770 [Epilithonimonas bovis DSM 19482]|uniref:YycE-like N-terminal domain-containing protein n=1 Tax=Epilithonimonas bovis DSM 19482 TaxID=1121284 RepID=A0A1U7PX34_9FLAO|nr:hypothetical protein SAMN05660493_01770 [Epilithonimonas bovis DSM 19482]
MIFRYARHTKNLEKLIDFYTKVLDFKVLGNFKEHNGYDVFFSGRKMRIGIWNSLMTTIFLNLNLMTMTFWFSIQNR